MRGRVLATDENLKGYYYDWEKKQIKQDGTVEYTYSKIPHKFFFTDNSTSGSTVFSATKGLEQTLTNFGVYQTNSNKWSIQTSNSDIPFKVGGKIFIKINGNETQFLITKIITLTSYSSGISSSRPFLDGFEKSAFPLLSYCLKLFCSEK